MVDGRVDRRRPQDGARATTETHVKSRAHLTTNRCGVSPSARQGRRGGEGTGERVKPAVARIVLGLLAGALAALSLDVLGYALYAGGTPEGATYRWEARLQREPTLWSLADGDVAREELGCRERVLHVADGELSGRYDLHVPRTHPLIAVIRDNVEATTSNWFTVKVLGEVQMLGPSVLGGDETDRDRYFLPTDPVVILPDADSRCGKARDDFALVRASFRAVRFLVPNQPVTISRSQFHPAKDLLTVDGAQVVVQAPAELAAAPSTRSVTEMTLPGDNQQANSYTVNLHWLDSNLAALTALRSPLPADVDRALRSLVTIFPVVLIVRVLRRGSASPDSGIRWLHRASVVLAGVSVAGAAFSLLLALEPWLHAASSNLAGWMLGGDVSYRTHPVPGRTGVDAVAAGLAAVLLPAALTAPAPTGASRPWRRWTAAGLGLAATSALIEATAQWLSPLLLDGATHGHKSQLAVAAATASTYLTFLAIVHRWFPSTVNGPLLATLTSVVTSLFVLIHPVVVGDGSQPMPTLAATGLWAAVAALLMLAFMAVGVRSVWIIAAARGIASTRWLGSPVRLGWAAAACCAVALAIVPTVVGLALWPPHSWAMNEWGFCRIVELFGALSWYAVLLVAAAALAVVDRDRSVYPDDDVLLLGAAFATIGFYWPDLVWYLPTSFILGFLTVRYVTFSAHPQTSQFTVRTRRFARRLRRDLAAIEHAERQLTPASAASMEDYAAKQRVLDQQRNAIHLAPRPHDRSRPSGGGWKHAASCAATATILGLPWVIVTFGFQWYWTGDQFFDGLDLTETAGWQVLQWPLLGFFFGYFYPRIRGNSGTAKGATLFLTVILPPVLGRWFSNGTQFWLDYLAQCGETLTFCLLLGVAGGDRWILKQAGLRLTHLLDIHGKRTTFAWATTLILAQTGLLAAVVSGVIPPLLQEFGILTSK